MDGTGVQIADFGGIRPRTAEFYIKKRDKLGNSRAAAAKAFGTPESGTDVGAPWCGVHQKGEIVMQDQCEKSNWRSRKDSNLQPSA